MKSLNLYIKGISLIIVVIILVTVVILSLQKNNILNQADKAKFLQNIN